MNQNDSIMHLSKNSPRGGEGDGWELTPDSPPLGWGNFPHRVGLSAFLRLSRGYQGWGIALISAIPEDAIFPCVMSINVLIEPILRQSPPLYVGDSAPGVGNFSPKGGE